MTNKNYANLLDTTLSTYYNIVSGAKILYIIYNYTIYLTTCQVAI